jgi:hypothetical protein
VSKTLESKPQLVQISSACVVSLDHSTLRGESRIRLRSARALGVQRACLQRGKSFSKSEVGNLHRTVAGQQNVGGLDVSVDDASRFEQENHSVAELHGGAGNLLRHERLAEVGTEIPAVHIIEHKQWYRSIKGPRPNNVGMRQQTDPKQGLMVKTFARIALEEQLPTKRLEKLISGARIRARTR